MAEHNKLGKKGEDIASSYLEQKGYTVLEHSWRFRHREIDIIACDSSGMLIFIEVKTRTSNYWGDPREFVSLKKQKYLIEASEQYINKQNYNGDSRFDIISVLFNDSGYIIEHLENAFYP